jgi:hypothetical protein
LNVLDFDDDALEANTFWYALGDSTLFVVAIADAVAGQANVSGIVFESNFSASTDEYGLRLEGTSTRAQVIVYDQPTTHVLSVSTATPYATWDLWRVQDTTTNMKLFRDGVQDDSDNYTRPGGGLALGFFSVGGYRLSVSSRRQLNGAIAEVIIYDSVLSAGDITLVEDYLTDKWGL